MLYASICAASARTFRAAWLAVTPMTGPMPASRHICAACASVCVFPVPAAPTTE